MEGRNPDRYKWAALALLGIAFFLHQGTRQIFGATLPQIRGFFGVSKAEIGVVGTVFQLVYGVVLPFAGIVADMFRRKWLVVAGVAVFCGGVFAGGFAASVGALLVAYGVLNAFGQATYYPSTMSLVAQLHEKSRATAFSIMQCGLYAGILFCSVAAGRLSESGPEAWRTPFWIFGGIGLLWVFALAFFLRDTKPAARGEGAQEKASASEALKAMFSKRSPACLIIGLGMMIYVDIGFKIWTPTFLMETFAGLTPSAAALHAVLWHYLGAFLGITFSSRISDRLAGRRHGIRMETNIAGLACAAPFIFLMANAPTLPLCCLGMGLFGFFRGVYDSNILAALFDVINPRYHASGSAIMLACASTFGSMAPTVLGWIGDHTTMRTGFSTLAGFYLAGAAAILVARMFFLEKEYVAK